MLKFDLSVKLREKNYKQHTGLVRHPWKKFSCVVADLMRKSPWSGKAQTHNLLMRSRLLYLPDTRADPAISSKNYYCLKKFWNSLILLTLLTFSLFFFLSFLTSSDRDWKSETDGIQWILDEPISGVFLRIGQFFFFLCKCGLCPFNLSGLVNRIFSTIPWFLSVPRWIKQPSLDNLLRPFIISALAAWVRT